MASPARIPPAALAPGPRETPRPGESARARAPRANVVRRPRSSPRARTAAGPSDVSRSGAHLEDVILTNGRTTDMAHALWRAVLREGDLAVDATAGNGWDTVELARLVTGESSGRVVAFDVQPAAIASTSARLDDALDPARRARVELVLDSHANMTRWLRPRRTLEGDAGNRPDPDSDPDPDPDPDPGAGAGVVCFNLGYLPGADADRSVTTETGSTVEALRAASEALRPGGVVTVVGYVGHAGGDEETRAVKAWAAALDPRRFTATVHGVVNRINCPQLIAVHKKRA